MCVVMVVSDFSGMRTVLIFPYITPIIPYKRWSCVAIHLLIDTTGDYHGEILPIRHILQTM